LATDEWLRVEGCDGVYALGDTATINQRRVMVSSLLTLFLCVTSQLMNESLTFCFVLMLLNKQEDIAAIFNKADKGNTGTLKKKDFNSVVKDICQRYPQVELYLKKNKLKNIANLLKSANGEDTQVNIEKFKQALSEVDSQMKNLPATAQVSLL